jgi:hypothetical protein
VSPNIYILEEKIRGKIFKPDMTLSYCCQGLDGLPGQPGAAGFPGDVGDTGDAGNAVTGLPGKYN